MGRCNGKRTQRWLLEFDFLCYALGTGYNGCFQFAQLLRAVYSHAFFSVHVILQQKVKRQTEKEANVAEADHGERSRMRLKR